MGDRFYDPARPVDALERAGIRGVGRDFEGHRLCVYMSPTATEDQLQEVIRRLDRGPDIQRLRA